MPPKRKEHLCAYSEPAPAKREDTLRKVSVCMTDARQQQASTREELTQIYEREKPPTQTRPGHSQRKLLRANAESTDNAEDPDTAATRVSWLVRM